MRRYFGPDGLLAENVTHFEFRPSQLEMAEAVLEALAARSPLVVEAGTGTGKTWAYLVPAILSGKRTVVSTGTKTLQDQILDQDIPFLKRTVFPRLRAVCLKGRGNYLCHRRFKDFSYQPTLWNKEEARLWSRFQKWATRTRTGDRAEISWLPDQFHTWNEVCSAGEHCLGQQCSDVQRCFVTRLRAEAAQAHLVVVNHHLFFADLALRDKADTGVLPEYDAVIFDEAHQLEDVMGQYFGIQFNSYGLMELTRVLQREFKKETGASHRFHDARRIVQQLEVLNRLLHRHLFEVRGSQGRFPLDMSRMGKNFVQSCNQLIHALDELAPMIAPAEHLPLSFEASHRRASDLSGAVRMLLAQEDESLVYWYEVGQNALFLNATPIEVCSIFRRRVLTPNRPVILTSATLSVAGSFDFVRQSLGIAPDSKSIRLPSPFAYAEQTMLYIPRRFPAPNEHDFCRQIAEQSVEILLKTRGRALFLFTSYRNMNEVHQLLRDRLPYPILVQGQKPKRALLAEFKESIGSVLFATSSFRQGIDVPGEALSCLLIDKLPFEVPDDPLAAARMDFITRQGKSSFFGYQVPRAVIQLKQGVGRLIRSSSDRGLIVIFDVRLLQKNYGQIFLKSLPPCRLVHQLDAIDEFQWGPSGLSSS